MNLSRRRTPSAAARANGEVKRTFDATFRALPEFFPWRLLVHRVSLDTSRRAIVTWRMMQRGDGRIQRRKEEEGSKPRADGFCVATKSTPTAAVVHFAQRSEVSLWRAKAAGG